ncbi:uncharacterized protein JN550_002534 [Neoarthrinium moseri]|uniref:uncharacterized protein n=1 Tax=Neoarthrinium moseri TaxID=1658444 RepID=UPI001FDCEDA0|nr:uncharacterized protein JN550_002534 [Neoarthrinium moseri]KAI1875105.1 hypothetical protein JN550_002534 [Neoarthrinium moseri]
MPSKRTLLWDYTLTRDFPSTQGIKDTVGTFKANGLLTNVINWNAWRPTELPAFFHFQPMVRTAAQLEGNEWEMIKTSVKNEMAKPGNGEVIVLTFNEPERIPLAPGRAAELWRQKILPLRKQHGARLKLVSPSCASDPAGSKWLEDFMKILGGGEKPDYLGAHFYTAQNQPADQGVNSAKSYLTSLHSKYNLPIIVSEIASTSRNGGDVEKFSRDIAGWMDGQPWIKQYAFFGAMRQVADGFVSPAAQLLDQAGHWTKLGKWWAGV